MIIQVRVKQKFSINSSLSSQAVGFPTLFHQQQNSLPTWLLKLQAVTVTNCSSLGTSATSVLEEWTTMFLWYQFGIQGKLDNNLVYRRKVSVTEIKMWITNAEANCKCLALLLLVYRWKTLWHCRLYWHLVGNLELTFGLGKMQKTLINLLIYRNIPIQSTHPNKQFHVFKPCQNSLQSNECFRVAGEMDFSKVWKHEVEDNGHIFLDTFFYFLCLICF